MSECPHGEMEERSKVSDAAPRASRAAVINGELQHVSVSQLQTFRACNRKWWFNKVAGLPSPVGKGALRGTEGHQRLEHLYKTGQNVLDKLEQLGLDRNLLPVPGPNLASEVAISSTYAGVPLIGYIDLIDRRAFPIALIDFKFKGDIGKYGSTVFDLRNVKSDSGLQMLTYAAAVKEPLTNLVHLTFQTRGRMDVVKTEVHVPLDAAVLSCNNEIPPLVEGMKKAAKAGTHLEVFGNEKHCGAYGGCPYLSQCFDPMARFKAALKASRAGHGLAEQTEAKTDPDTFKALTRAVMQEEVQENVQEDIKEATQMALLADSNKPVDPYFTSPSYPRAEPSAAPAAATPQTPPAAERPIPKADAPKVPALPVVSVLPPDQPVPAKPGSKIIWEGNTGPVAAVEEATPEPGPFKVAALLGQEAPKKRGPGRPKSPPTGMTSGPIPLPPAPPTAASPTAPPPPTTASDTKPPAAPVVSAGGAGGISLFVDCLPGGSTIPVAAIAQRINDEILDALKLNAEGNGIDDVRMATDNTLGFNKWKAHVASCVIDDLKAGKILPGRYVAIQDSDERVKVVIDTLAARLPADAIVRGIR